MDLMTKVSLRFYKDLNYFLRPGRKYRFFRMMVSGHPAVKDTLEAAGVPHTEINGIMINGKWANFSRQLQPGDIIQVFPPFLPDRRPRPALWPPLPKSPAFVLDGHLGKLAKTLRLLGLDCIYYPTFADEDIVALGVSQKRIILTRDRGILKHRQVRWGYCLRTLLPPAQVRAVLRRYQLVPRLKPFTRCLECNGLLLPVPKASILPHLPPRIRAEHNQFHQCRHCGRLYWKGSHYQAMLAKIGRLHL